MEKHQHHQHLYSLEAKQPVGLARIPQMELKETLDDFKDQVQP